jgi:multidrug resistance efflux pump
MSPHRHELQERYGQALTQVDKERSTNAKLKQKIVDLTQNLTQAEEASAKVEILEEKVKELSQEASIARAEAQQAKRDEDQALTKLCRTVVGKDNLIDELRQKLTEKDRLILTLQETDTLEL